MNKTQTPFLSVILLFTMVVDTKPTLNTLSAPFNDLVNKNVLGKYHKKQEQKTILAYLGLSLCRLDLLPSTIADGKEQKTRLEIFLSNGLAVGDLHF